MSRPRRIHSPDFKAKMDFSAVEGDVTWRSWSESSMSTRTKLKDWKKQLLKNASDVFGNDAQKAEQSEENIEQLHTKIDELTIEKYFVDRELQWIHEPSGKK